MDIYIPTPSNLLDTLWPVQQSLTEQKQKSGLFTCSAEFIRPVGNTELPTVIQTSIGSVDVWPDPTISIGTDGFEKINATGYGVWDSSLVEEVKSFTPGIIELTAQSKFLKANPENPSFPVTPYEISGEQTYTEKINVVYETSFIRKLGDVIPPAPALRILDYNTQDITSKIYNISELPSFFTYQFDYSPGASNVSASIQKIISHIKLNTYGTTQEIETAFEIAPVVIDFGMWVGLKP